MKVENAPVLMKDPFITPAPVAIKLCVLVCRSGAAASKRQSLTRYENFDVVEVMVHAAKL